MVHVGGHVTLTSAVGTVSSYQGRSYKVCPVRPTSPPGHVGLMSVPAKVKKVGPRLGCVGPSVSAGV